MRDDFSDAARETFAEAEFPRDGGKLQAARSSQLPLSEQEKAIAVLHETIEQLASFLNPALKPVNETTGVERQDEPDSPKSPLTQQLEANNRGINRASHNLQGLMQRLEL